MANLTRKRRSKIKSPEALRAALARLRRSRRNFRIVFTNGCFDLLHKGHVTYLEQARFCGDLLVVALNSDESVRRIKGPDRPVNNLGDRLDVLAALESVDYVTWFTDETPIRLLQSLKPEIYVKGGDWKIRDLPEAPLVRGWGGRVKVLSFVKGRSTTRLIRKISAG